MTPERLRRLMKIFQELCDVDPHSRAALLEAHCAGDDELRCRLERMFSQDAHGNGAIDGRLGATLLAAEIGSETELPLPEEIGGYRIIREIGHGGMGVVYEAQQQRPLRKVALKLIRREFSSHDLLRRFEYETHVLGQLDHPGIAHIYDAGSIEAVGSSWPYFAMEFVDGRPLDKHVKARGLTIRQILELMARVCDAAQHAHQKGIIHRDLKPANILVKSSAARSGETDFSATVDEVGQPKVLDFGIARATESENRGLTLETQVGQIVGTVAYMSPEQIQGRSSELDTRSDVYTIGVLLYELLSEQPCFDLSGMPIGEAIRRVTEQQPPRLGTVRSALRGDIETIVAKAMNKDVDQRYPSAAMLAEDLRRFLRSEPIAARPPSTLYQVGRFARRNKALVGAIATSFVLLVAGIVGTGWSLDASLHANESLEQRNRELHQVSNFQVAQLAALDVPTLGSQIHAELLQALPESDRSAAGRMLADVNLTNVALAIVEKSLLDPTIEAIDEQFAEQPVVRAKLLYSLSLTSRELGLPQRALEPLTRALDLQKRVLGAGHRDTLVSVDSMGTLLGELDRGLEAERLFLEALEGRRRLFGDDHIETLASMNNLAGCILAQEGRLEEAEKLYLATLAGRRRALGEEHPHTINSVHNLGFLMQAKGKHEEAEEHYRAAMEVRTRIHGESAPETLASTSNLAGACLEQGKFDEAGTLFERALSVRRSLWGDDHPDTVLALHNLGGLRLMSGDPEGAVGCFREAVERRRRTLGDDHHNVDESLRALSYTLKQLELWAEARTCAELRLEISRRKEPEPGKAVASAMTDLVQALLGQGEYSRAEEIARNCLDLRHEMHPAGHWTIWISQSQLGEAIAADPTRLREAEPLLVEAAEEMRPPPRMGQFGKERLLRALRRVTALYESLHAIDPEAGHDESAKRWRARLSLD